MNSCHHWEGYASCNEACSLWWAATKLPSRNKLQLVAIASMNSTDSINTWIQKWDKSDHSWEDSHEKTLTTKRPRPILELNVWAVRRQCRPLIKLALPRRTKCKYTQQSHLMYVCRYIFKAALCNFIDTVGWCWARITNPKGRHLKIWGLDCLQTFNHS